MSNPRACVVIPAYNAERTLEALFERLKPLGLDTVLVNDGSTDRTAQIAVTAGALTISHVSNRGKGSALKTGFAYALRAGYELVITMDSDGQHDPGEIPKLLEAAADPNARIVIGHRALEAERMPLLRRWTNRMMSAVISALTRQRIPDSQCGFRGIRREALQTLPLSGRRFDLESELLLAAARRGWPIVSVPIRTIYEAHPSHIRPVLDGLRFVRLVMWYLLSQQEVRQ